MRKKSKFGIVVILILLTVFATCSSFWIYQEGKHKKDVQSLYRFMIDNEQIDKVTSNIKDTYVNYKDKFFGITDLQYSTETRIKLAEILLNHQKTYTNEELQIIYQMIEISQKDLKQSISNHQKIIDFYLSLVVAMRDRKNDEVMKSLASYYSEKGGMWQQDNLYRDTDKTKQKIASMMGFTWAPWWEK